MHRLREVLPSFVSIVGLALAATAVSLLLDPKVELASNPWIIAVNCLPMLLLALGLLALTRKPLLSLAIAAVPLLLLHLANHLKLQILGNVVMMQDLTLLTQVATNPDLFSSYLGIDAMHVAWLLLVLATLLLLAWKEPRLLSRNIMLRGALAVLAVAGLAFLFTGGNRVQALYSYGEVKLRSIPFPQKVVNRVGLLGSMLYFNSREAGNPDDVDLTRVQAFLHSHGNDIERRKTKPMPSPAPDIIMIQVEALFDPSMLAGMEGSGMFADFHALQQQGTYGSLHSPAFGGITIRAEFEALTAYPFAAFRDSVYPYYGTVNTGTNSLARLLDHRGYRTTAVHPFRAGFWNRKTALNLLGFESTHFIEAFEHARKRGPYVADEELFSRVLRYAEQPGPDLVFAITMENHGPWLWPARLDKYSSEWEKLPVPASLHGEARIELQKYLYHVQHGQHALAALANAVMRRKQPTLLVVYGDHLPAFRAVFKQARFANGLPAKAQRVPYFILDNHHPVSRRVDSNLYFLPAMVLAQAGIPMNEYFAAAIQASQGFVPGVGRGTPTERLMVQMARLDYAGQLPRH